MSTTRTWVAIAGTAIVLLAAGTLLFAGAAQTPLPADPAQRELLLDARELRDAGFVAESEAKVAAYVERFGDEDLPASLRPAGSRQGFWESGLHALGPWARTIAEIIALVLALAIVVTLASATRRSIDKRRHRALNVAPFTGPGAGEIATSLASALRECLKRLDADRPSTGPRLAEATDAEFALPESVSTAFPPAGLITGLLGMLDRLLPRRLDKLTSTLRPIDDVKGAGITLLLCNRRGAELGQVTIWECDFHLDELVKDATDDDVGGRYQRLILPAAIWLAYQESLHAGDQPPGGTGDWMSYAHFAVAELAHRHGDRRLACRLYREALDLDPKNLAARLNLAWLIVLPAADEQPHGALRRGAEFEAHIHAVLSAVRRTDPLWFRATYLKAVHQLHMGRADKAQPTVERLQTEIARQRGTRLERLLASMVDPVNVLAGAIAVELGEDPREPEVAAWPLPTTHYNLACFHARRLRLLRGDDWAAARRLALDHLEEAIERLGPAYVDDARRDPALLALHDDPEFERLVPPPVAAEPAPGEAVPV